MTEDATAGAGHAPGIAATHPLLYHYTREHAFRSIVLNNTFWATYFQDLTDAAEFRHMRAPLAEALGERFIPAVEAFAKRGPWEADTVRRQGGVTPGARAVGKRLMENLTRAAFGGKPQERLHACFVASFCSHAPDSYAARNGLLSQWRGYGSDGGFCLVFDTERLEALIEEERRAYQYLFIRLGAAHYFKDRTSMPARFTELVANAGDILAPALAGAEFSADELFESFVTAATTIKHRGFEEESEVRLVAMPLSLLGDEKRKGAPGYRSMPVKTSFACDINARRKNHIRLFGPDRGDLPVTSVIVGPARDQKRNIEIARETVGKGVEIVRSETPLVP